MKQILFAIFICFFIETNEENFEKLITKSNSYKESISTVLLQKMKKSVKRMSLKKSKEESVSNMFDHSESEPNQGNNKKTDKSFSSNNPSQNNNFEKEVFFDSNANNQHSFSVQNSIKEVTTKKTENENQMRDYFDPSNLENKSPRKYPNQQNESFLERLRAKREAANKNKTNEHFLTPPNFPPLLSVNFIQDSKKQKSLLKEYLDPELNEMLPKKFEYLINLTLRLNEKRNYPKKEFSNHLKVNKNKKYILKEKALSKSISSEEKDRKCVLEIYQKLSQIVYTFKEYGIAEPMKNAEENKTYEIKQEEIQHFLEQINKPNISLDEMEKVFYQTVSLYNRYLKKHLIKYKNEEIEFERREKEALIVFRKEKGESKPIEEKYVERLKNSYENMNKWVQQMKKCKNKKKEMEVLLLKIKYGKDRIYSLEKELEKERQKKRK